jgi:hypothetical protein
MGFFDRSSDRKPVSGSSSSTDATTSGVMARLVSARECIEAKDLPGAMAIYEEVLATSGDRADVLVTISADLGVNGHVSEIVDLVAPRYDAERHGPATGLNLLQAYLAQRNPTAAQHVLDILFALNRPELQERLYGFSNAIAELIHSGQGTEQGGPIAAPEDLKVNLASISKPIWFYGLEPLAAQILPPKAERLRRVAFGQLAVLGIRDIADFAKRPEEELGRLSRAVPLWFAETFYFSPQYAPIAAIGLQGSHYAVFGAEWTMENLRQLVESTQGGLDYVFTGALRQVAGDYELILRVWEVKKFRERKQFTARWAPATANAELAKLHEQVRLFMEWAPEKSGLRYVPPAAPRDWLDVLGSSVSLFLADKNLLAKEQLTSTEEILARAAAAANTSEAASLAYITLRNRAEKLNLAAKLDAALAGSPLIAQAQQMVSGGNA